MWDRLPERILRFDSRIARMVPVLGRGGHERNRRLNTFDG